MTAEPCPSNSPEGRGPAAQLLLVVAVLLAILGIGVVVLAYGH